MYATGLKNYRMLNVVFKRAGLVELRSAVRDIEESLLRENDIERPNAFR